MEGKLPQISEKLLRQWLCGFIIKGEIGDLNLAQCQDADKRSRQIIDFLKEHNLLHPNIKPEK